MKSFDVIESRESDRLNVALLNSQSSLYSVPDKETKTCVSETNNDCDITG